MPEQPADAEGLSFILPVCNQAAALEPALTAWANALETLRRPYEMLVVDDGSSDATVPTLAALVGTPESPGPMPRLRVLRHPSRQGFGAALRTAIAEARQPLLFYTGLDYDYSPADLPKFLERIAEADPELQKRPDLINGYRSRVPVPRGLRVLGTIWRAFLRIVFGIPAEPLHGWLGWPLHRYRFRLRWLFGVRLQDVNSKFKLLRRHVFERFPIQSDGEFVHAEIIAKVNFLGSLMDEMPIAKQPGPYSPIPEPAPAPPSLRAELRRVFRRPVFLALPAPESPPPADALPPETAPAAPG